MTADGPQPSPTPKSWYQQWWVWAIAVVGVLVVIGLVVGTSGGEDEATATTVVTETTGADETTTLPAETTTTVPQETTTTLPAVLAAGEGRGAAVVEFDIPTVPAVIDFTHDGAGAFSVMKLDPDLEHITHVTITYGPHEGTGGVQLTNDEIVGGLEIEADGNWTYEIRPVSGEPEIACPVEGRSEDVIILSAFKDRGGQAHVTYAGENPFSITAYGDGESSLLVNEVGPYEGTFDVPAGLYVWFIDAMFDDAMWSIDC